MVGREGHAGVYLRGAHLRANLRVTYGLTYRLTYGLTDTLGFGLGFLWWVGRAMLVSI